MIAYRGSEKKFQDWRTDFKIKLEDDNTTGNKLHRGFKKGVGNTVKPANSAVGKKMPVIMCGHSLGGALAVMHAVLAAPANLNAIYTIGQPRIGQIAPTNQLPGVGFFRVVNDADIVPRVPYAIMGYRHFGSLVRCDKPLPLNAVDYKDTQASAAAEVLKYAGDLADSGKQLVKATAIKVHGRLDQLKGWLGLGNGNSEPSEAGDEEKEELRKLWREIKDPAADHSASEYVDQLGRDVT